MANNLTMITKYFYVKVCRSYVIIEDNIFYLIWRQCASLFTDFTFDILGSLNSYIIIYYSIITFIEIN